jgi:hypothetical protein
MIADCAVDPEVFATWRHFQSLHEDFGVSRGRLISKFPKKWVKSVAERSRELVHEGINTEMQATRIEERLRSERFKRKMKSPGGRQYDPLQTWTNNAQASDPAFDLIVTSGMISIGNLVGAEVLLKDVAPFLRATQRQVRRTAESLVGVATHLLAGAVDVVIIDPNFRADEPRFCNTLKHLISTLEGTGRAPNRLEIHTNRIRNQGEVFRRGPHFSQWNTHLVPELPAGWKISVCYWDQLPNGGRPHARFLLTDCGGLYYDHGIDEGEGDTLVTLLEDNIWEGLFGVFNSSSLLPDFDIAQHVLTFTG